VISVHDPDREAAFGELSRFRQEFYESLSARADALFELTEGVLPTPRPPAMARRSLPVGTGCIPGSRTARVGWSMTVSCPSSRAP
jgi:hypothetical protein